jgi:hypothetical protein
LRLLRGCQLLTPEEMRVGHDALTPAQLRAMAAQSLGTALLQLPEDVDVDLPDLPVLDGEDQSYDDAPVMGRTHRKRALALAPPSLRAVVGDSGASLQFKGDTLTVLWDDVVGLGVGPHDRVLVAADGTVLELSGKYLRDASDLFATTEAHIHKGLWFELSEN